MRFTNVFEHFEILIVTFCNSIEIPSLDNRAKRKPPSPRSPINASWLIKTKLSRILRDLLHFLHCWIRVYFSLVELHFVIFSKFTSCWAAALKETKSRRTQGQSVHPYVYWYVCPDFCPYPPPKHASKTLTILWEALASLW